MVPTIAYDAGKTSKDERRRAIEGVAKAGKDSPAEAKPGLGAGEMSA
jgi:hypothetical protein